MVQQMKLSSISLDTKTLTPASVRVAEFKFRHDLDALSINKDWCILFHGIVFFRLRQQQCFKDSLNPDIDIFHII